MLFLNFLFINNFYPDSSFNKIENFNDRLLISEGNLFIFNCFFNSLSLVDSGGSIYISSNNLNIIFIENCIFYNLNCNSHGGAIYLNIPSGESFIYKSCGFNCSSKGDDHFSYINTHNSKNNQFYLNSISQCSPFFIGIHFPITFLNGLQAISNLNSSNNKINYHSGCGLYSYNKTEISFSTFSKNYVQGYCCFSFYGSFNDRIIKKSNFIFNNSPSLSVIYVSSSPFPTIDSCIFQNNSNVLFSSSLNIINSFIQHSGTLGQSISSQYLIYTSTQKIYHFYTFFCLGFNFKNTERPNIQKQIFKFLFFLSLY